MRPLAVALLTVLAFHMPGNAEDKEFWLKKPYQQWSQQETAHMMHDSPWAVTITLRSTVNSAAQIASPTGPATVGDYASNGELDPTVAYTVQLCSAAPIRQAMVRTSQISSHYDTMTAEQKAALDAQANKFLAVTFPDRVVVCVKFHSNVDNYQSLLRSYWSAQTAPKLRDTVFLDAGRDRIAVTGYAYKDESFQFVFPRPKPDVTEKSPLALEFVHPNIDLVRSQNLHLDFKPKKMLINGVPAL